MNNLIRIAFCILILFACAFTTRSQTASFSVSQTGGCSPLSITFDASDSEGLGTLNYIWTFGNGNSTIGTDKEITTAIYTSEGVFTIELQVEDDTGRSEVFTQQIEVFPNPQPTFTTSNDIGGIECMPFDLSIEDNTTSPNGEITSWTWDFGDGNISSSENPEHTYRRAGSYNLTVIIGDVLGCTGDTTITNFITVRNPFNLDFRTDPPNASTSTCSDNLSLDLIPEITGGSGTFAYSWDFGDSTSSTDAEVTKNFTQIGESDISLTVTDLVSGCSKTIAKEAYVSLGSVAPSFTMDKTEGCVGLDVQFTNISEVITSNQEVTWYFGDGDSLVGTANNEALIAPTHTYSTQGTFTPSIKINTNNGECEETYVSDISITTSTKPIISFNVDETRSCNRVDSFNFTSNVTAASNANLSYNWNFGNGTSSSEINPTATYSNFGRYSPRLTVTDQYGCSASLVKDNLIVTRNVEARFTSDILDDLITPEQFNANRNLIAGGCIPLDITFTDNSVSPTPIVSREWTFGDGKTNSGNNEEVTNTYTVEGSYDVSLTITTEDGCTATRTCNSCARAGTKPTARLDTSQFPLESCCNVSYEFKNLTDTSTADFLWYEVVGEAAYGVNLNENPDDANWLLETQFIPFEENGTPLDLVFYAYNNGCYDTLYYDNWLTVHQPYVEPVLQTDPCSYTQQLNIDSIYINNNIDQILWNFEYQNQSSHDLFPSFDTPTEPGTYNLSVTASDFTNAHNLTNGEQYCTCSYDTEVSFPGIDIPLEFSANTTEGCLPLEVRFTAPAGYNKYQWNFGNGKTSTQRNPTVVYDQAGLFNVRLTVADGSNCQKTLLQQDYIRAIGINPQIDTTDIYGCVPLDISLTDVTQHNSSTISRYWLIENGDSIADVATLNYTFNDVLPSPNLQKDGIDVTLVVTDDNNCTNRTTSTIYPSAPIAEFSFERILKCDGDSIVFNPTISDSLGITPFKTFWDYDDNSETYDSIGNTHFYKEGSYDVRLIIEDAIGCGNTSSAATVNVIAPEIQAEFTVDDTLGACTPVIFDFTDQSYSRTRITDWTWIFGDSIARSNEQNPRITFNQNGSHDVLLAVRDSIGCTDTILKENYIRVAGIVAEIDIPKTNFCVGDTVSFDVINTNGNDFQWDLGDGRTLNGRTQDYVYNSARTVTISLIVEDTNSLTTCNDLFIETINIIAPPRFDLGNDTSICSKESIEIGYEMPNVNYLWNTNQVTSHITVQNPNTYILSLNDITYGCTYTDSITIDTLPLPQISITQDREVCIGTDIQLESKVDKTVREYTWLTNGEISTKDSNIVLLVGTEDINIVLEVIDSSGCYSERSALITAVPPPEYPDKQFDPCVGNLLTVNVDEVNTLGLPGSSAWERKDGLITDSSESISFREDERVELKLRTENCIVTLGANVTFRDYPVLSKNDLIYFCPEDEGTVEITTEKTYPKYYWWFTSDSSQSIYVSEGGTYTVSLGNKYNCFIEDYIIVEELCGPKVFVADAFTPNGDDLNDTFELKYRAVGRFAFTIFNRWGEIIFQTDDISESWDGTYNGKDMPPGVYPWILEYKGIEPLYDKERYQLEGRVTLIR